MSSVLNDKIRLLREMKHWSQEQMAERVSMSKNGYARIERGETKLTVEALDKISQAFDMDIIELIKISDKGLICLFSENNNATQYGNFYQGSENLTAEIDKLKLSIKHQADLLEHKDELLSQQTREIETLRQLVETLKPQ